MIIGNPCDKREETVVNLSTDLCIVGGGFCGACAAITAARNGIKVVLIQDRPVLGGNGSSEIRIWMLGATSHMGNNNRWAIEGGVVQELFLENLWRNKEGNPIIWDYMLIEKVKAEKNITLLLNTSAYAAEKSDPDTISEVKAFSSQTSTFYNVKAPLFIDDTGDGLLGFLTGAAFRMGMEAQSEFGELYAPKEPKTELLGHSILFTTKDIGKPVKYVAPSMALSIEEVEKMSIHRPIDIKSKAKFWWIEYGGQFNTIKKAEDIKDELWRATYGIWNYIKNSGKYPEAENMTLEWVAQVPGKRESRRFEGDTFIIQQDVIEQRPHYDDVSYGGWALDHHPTEGLYGKTAPCVQWHSKGVYTIPYRTMYSRNIKNLFLGGRVISASHVAFGTTRVMATCGHNGQAIGMAAALCISNNFLPRDLASEGNIRLLQSKLLRMGQYIPNVVIKDSNDLAQRAKVSASSNAKIGSFKSNGETRKLTEAWAMMLPVTKGKMPKVSYLVNAAKDTVLKAELRISQKTQNHTPDVTVATQNIALKKGDNQWVDLDFGVEIDAERYAFVCLMANDDVCVQLSDERFTGVLSVGQKFNKAVAESAAQTPPAGIGIESFEFWLPERRPGGKNFAMKVEPAIKCFEPENVLNGVARPVSAANAWVACNTDSQPTLTLKWDSPQHIKEIDITFDSDYDHPLEHILMGHYENAVPFCVRNFKVKDASGNLIAEEKDWHNALKSIKLETPVKTDSITIECFSTWGAPAAIFEVRCY